MKQSESLKKIGILYHPMVEATRLKAEKLKGFLESRGISVWLCSAWEEKEARARLDGTGLILTVGGDGTILRAAQVVIPDPVPITGINLGKLGFMTEFSADEAEKGLALLLEGNNWIDERAMLQAEIMTSGEEPPCKYHALNDVVVARGAIARVIYVDASVDGQPLTTYKADGVIVATATGSTGYSLSAGGPVLYPQSGDFLLVPIMPHISSACALVLPSVTTVELRITAVHDATLSIDGYANLPVSSGESITVKQSPNRIRFLRISSASSFYGSLERRLKGKR